MWRVDHALPRTASPDTRRVVCCPRRPFDGRYEDPLDPGEIYTRTQTSVDRDRNAFILLHTADDESRQEEACRFDPPIPERVPDRGRADPRAVPLRGSSNCTVARCDRASPAERSVPSADYDGFTVMVTVNTPALSATSVSLSPRKRRPSVSAMD